MTSLRCRVLGHRVRFHAEGESMIWECERECGFGGRKAYVSPGEAERYARALDRSDAAGIGRRAPLSMVLLRLARRGDRETGPG